MKLVRPMYKISNIFWYLVIMFAVSSCAENDDTDLKNYIKSVNARPKSSIEPLKEQKVVDPFIFDPEGLRDPFNPIDRVAEEVDADMLAGNGLRPDFTRRKEELESYSLDTLRMVGTMSKDSILWALVKASDGTIHRVRQGNYLGRNHGKIIQITEASIGVMEIIPGNRKGLWREQQASLALTE